MSFMENSAAFKYSFWKNNKKNKTRVIWRYILLQFWNKNYLKQKINW